MAPAERNAVAQDLVKQIQGWTSVGDADELAQRVLEEQFGGRRDSVRTFRFLEIVVQGTGGTFKAMGINISRTGVLFRITDPKFAAEGERQHLMPYTARVWQNFSECFHVFLEGGAISREAEIVRVSGYCGKTSSLVLVGCRFLKELSGEECELLGIPSEDA